MVHADHTFDKHPLVGFAANVEGRGADAEFCLHGIDPDKAEANARTQGYTVLASALDKPHGLREAYILDPDGYCAGPGRPVEQRLILSRSHRVELTFARISPTIAL